MDITPVFGTVVLGSSPGRGTVKQKIDWINPVDFLFVVVRVGRIELPFYRWQRYVLPLNYTRK